MSVKVYGCNHVAIEVGDVEKAAAFYQDVFNLEKLDEGEGDAFFNREIPVSALYSWRPHSARCERRHVDKRVRALSRRVTNHADWPARRRTSS